MQGYRSARSAPRAARLQASLRSILKGRDSVNYEPLSIPDTLHERQTRIAVNAQLLHVRFRSLAGSQLFYGIEPHKNLGITACAIASDCRSLLGSCCQAVFRAVRGLVTPLESSPAVIDNPWPDGPNHRHRRRRQCASTGGRSWQGHQVPQ